MPTNRGLNGGTYPPELQSPEPAPPPCGPGQPRPEPRRQTPRNRRAAPGHHPCFQAKRFLIQRPVGWIWKTDPSCVPPAHAGSKPPHWPACKAQRCLARNYKNRKKLHFTLLCSFLFANVALLAFCYYLENPAICDSFGLSERLQSLTFLSIPTPRIVGGRLPPTGDTANRRGLAQ